MLKGRSSLTCALPGSSRPLRWHCFLSGVGPVLAAAPPLPKIIKEADRYALLVDGAPFLMSARLMMSRVEEGHYERGKWVFERVWNGDQTDYGLNLTGLPQVLRVRLADY